MYKLVYSNESDSNKLNAKNIVGIDNMTDKAPNLIIIGLLEHDCDYCHLYLNGSYISTFGPISTNLS